MRTEKPPTSATKPWHVASKPAREDHYLPGGYEPQEAIQLCLHCKKVRCHHNCREVAAVIREAKKKQKQGMEEST